MRDKCETRDMAALDMFSSSEELSGKLATIGILDIPIIEQQMVINSLIDSVERRVHYLKQESNNKSDYFAAEKIISELKGSVNNVDMKVAIETGQKLFKEITKLSISAITDCECVE